MRHALVLAAVMVATGSVAGSAVLAGPEDDQQPTIEIGQESGDPQAPTLEIGSAAAASGQNGGFGPDAVMIEIEPVWGPPSQEQVDTLQEISPQQQPAVSYDNIIEQDADGDQVPDAVDNCTWAWNSGQEDGNGNGIGDACEQQAEAPPPAPDTDGDGIPDDRDNCWQIANPTQKDGDGDGLGNGCDEGSAPFLIGDNPVEAQRIVEDAAIVTSGVPLDGGYAPGADLMPPVSETVQETIDYDRDSVVEEQQVAAESSADPAPPVVQPQSSDPGGGGYPAQDVNDLQASAAADASGRNPERDTPVERGERPRRNPELTEESGPVLPPPRSKLRMDEVLPGFQTVVRIDAGRLGAAPANAAEADSGKPEKNRTRGDNKAAKSAAREERAARNAEQPDPVAEPTSVAVLATTGDEAPRSDEPLAGDGNGPAAAPPTTPEPSRPRMPVPIEEGAVASSSGQGEDAQVDAAASGSADAGDGAILRWQSPRANGGVRDYLATPSPTAASDAGAGIDAEPADGGADPAAEPVAATSSDTPAADPVESNDETSEPSELKASDGGAREGKKNRKADAGSKSGREGKDRKDGATASAAWTPDDFYRGGEATASGDGKILGTSDDDIYRTQRTTTRKDRDNSFVYAIEVPGDGFYRVRIHFAETQAEGSRERVFDVDAEGEAAIQDLDIFAEVGQSTAVVKSFDVEVDDGTLELEFRGLVGRPVVSAIEVLQQVQKLPPVDKDKARRARESLDAMD